MGMISRLKLWSRRRQAAAFSFPVIVLFTVFAISKSRNSQRNAPGLFDYTRTPSTSLSCTRLLFLIVSAPGERERRATIRATWAREDRLEAIAAGRVFVVEGRSEGLDAEQREFGDILADGRLLGARRNLTRKVVSALHWVSRQPWKKLRYVAKVHSDSFVVPRFLAHLADVTWKFHGRTG